MLPANSQALSISGTAKWNIIFRLKKINEQLAAENTRLNQMLKEI